MRLFGLVILMFALLLAFTSRWTVFQASSLRNNPLNARSLLEQQRIDRGKIFAADGSVLARSVRTRNRAARKRSTSVYIQPAKSSRMRSATTTSTSAGPGSSATATRR